MNIILAGIGGQGVVFATKVISHAAMTRGQSVMASENHGMSQRGGSVQAHIKLGTSEAPLIRRGTADALVAFDRTEAMRNLPFIRAGGRVYVNSLDEFDLTVMNRLQELNVGVFTFNADACAKDLGSPAVTNLIVLGFAAARGGLGLSVADLQESVRVLGPTKTVELNLKALEIGARH